MKNKVVSGCFIIALVLLCGCYLFFNIAHRYDFYENGTIPDEDSHQQLMNHLSSMNKESRNNAIEFSVEYNLISQEEADSLYNK